MVLNLFFDSEPKSYQKSIMKLNILINNFILSLDIFKASQAQFETHDKIC